MFLPLLQCFSKSSSRLIEAELPYPMLKIQIPGPHPRPSEENSPGVGLRIGNLEVSQGILFTNYFYLSAFHKSAFKMILTFQEHAISLHTLDIFLKSC